MYDFEKLGAFYPGKRVDANADKLTDELVLYDSRDLGNLLLTFPELTPEHFRPWINSRQAAEQGVTEDEHAKAEAAMWKKGLADAQAEELTEILVKPKAADVHVLLFGLLWHQRQ